ncbi:MAG TPA: glycosyltransferase family 9 protein [Bryobacteraceae bacterium]|nr:glycosyltransferase family 9 protein [Bryobacteraceae bacterium]
MNRRLIIRPGAIGDCILSLPAMEHLRAGYTEVWVSSANVPLIRFADRVRAISSTGLDVVGFDGLSEPGLRQLESFDSIVSWYGAARPEFRQAVAHLPIEFHSALPPDATLHATDFYCGQVGIPAGAIPEIRCLRRDTGFVILHPFSSSPRKNWPTDKFRELAGVLKLPVQFCAGPEESFEGAVRLADLYQLAEWIATARIYIGNDSGITHLAAAVGVPVVALFRATNPIVWAPRGPRVAVLQGDPSVEQVRDAAIGILSR